jgi:hypothetical protein
MPKELAFTPTLRNMLSEAQTKLEDAKKPADILEAKVKASRVIDAVKRAAKFDSAFHDMKNAYFQLIGDAIKIDIRAEALYALEYDNAKQEGQVAGQGQKKKYNHELITQMDLCVTKQDMSRYRQWKQFEMAHPGLINSTIDSIASTSDDLPTKSLIKRVLKLDFHTKNLSIWESDETDIEKEREEAIAAFDLNMSEALNDIRAELTRPIQETDRDTLKRGLIKLIRNTKNVAKVLNIKLTAEKPTTTETIAEMFKAVLTYVRSKDREFNTLYHNAEITDQRLSNNDKVLIIETINRIIEVAYSWGDKIAFGDVKTIEAEKVEE